MGRCRNEKKICSNKGADFLKSSSNEIQASYSASASRALHLAGPLSGLGQYTDGLFLRSRPAFWLFLFSPASTDAIHWGWLLARYCALAGRDSDKRHLHTIPLLPLVGDHSHRRKRPCTLPIPSECTSTPPTRHTIPTLPWELPR